MTKKVLQRSSSFLNYDIFQLSEYKLRLKHIIHVGSLGKHSGEFGESSPLCAKYKQFASAFLPQQVSVLFLAISYKMYARIKSSTKTAFVLPIFLQQQLQMIRFDRVKVNENTN